MRCAGAISSVTRSGSAGRCTAGGGTSSRRRTQRPTPRGESHSIRRQLDAVEWRDRNRCRKRAKACAAALGDDAFLFGGQPDGSVPWRPGRVTLAFVRLCRDLDISNVRLHDLRHFAATQLLAAGVPVRTVAGRLGHANAATTLNVYAHVLESSDEEAAGVLGRLFADNH